MEKHIKHLVENNFEVHVVETLSDAKKLFFDVLLPKLSPKSVSWGGSKTVSDSGIIDELFNCDDLLIVASSGNELSEEQKHENRRQALLVDLFLTGANAISEQGQIVNLDAYGNRVAAMVFGPKNVVVFAGKNKLVGTLEEAMHRTKHHAAPLNSQRFPNRTIPCVKTCKCHNCKSPDRICNVWTITEKSYPRARIIVVIINEDLGF